MSYKRYNKKNNYSYTQGAFPTIELITKKPDIVEDIYIHEDFYEKDKIISLANKFNLRYHLSNKVVNRLSDKKNQYVIGVFNKFNNSIKNENHIVLNEVSDMGNLGNIIRTMVGFGFYDLVLIGEVADIYNPKTIRASMGSIFDIRFSFYSTIDDYLDEFFEREIYLFMLSFDEEDSLRNVKINKDRKISLVFGNEGSGLPTNYTKYGSKVFIPHSKAIDSLNLTTAAAIAMYQFTK